ncbi:hypothetical protein [Nostoc sp.]|uniref:hypothetical protein n=1 Tax=Nostoc sp. TaxID=1180 RepID=UPI002FF51B93
MADYYSGLRLRFSYFTVKSISAINKRELCEGILYTTNSQSQTYTFKVTLYLPLTQVSVAVRLTIKNWDILQKYFSTVI